MSNIDDAISFQTMYTGRICESSPRVTFDKIRFGLGQVLEIVEDRA